MVGAFASLDRIDAALGKRYKRASRKSDVAPTKTGTNLHRHLALPAVQYALKLLPRAQRAQGCDRLRVHRLARWTRIRCPVDRVARHVECIDEVQRRIIVRFSI